MKCPFLLEGSDHVRIPGEQIGLIVGILHLGPLSVSDRMLVYLENGRCCCCCHGQQCEASSLGTRFLFDSSSLSSLKRAQLGPRQMRRLLLCLWVSWLVAGSWSKCVLTGWPVGGCPVDATGSAAWILDDGGMVGPSIDGGGRERARDPEIPSSPRRAIAARLH